MTVNGHAYPVLRTAPTGRTPVGKYRARIAVAAAFLAAIIAMAAITAGVIGFGGGDRGVQQSGSQQGGTQQGGLPVRLTPASRR